MKQSRRGLFASVMFVVCFAMGLSACGPSIEVVRQATPNPLVGQHHFVVAPISWDGFVYNGQPEAAWLATRNPQQQAGWAQDKGDSTMRFLTRLNARKRPNETFDLLSGPPQPGQFVIAVNVLAMHGGRFTWAFRIVDASNQVVDEVRPPARGGGWGLAIQLAGLMTAGPDDVLSYIRSRTGP